MEERSLDLGGESGRMNLRETELFFGRLAERLRQKVEKAHFETWLSRLQCRGAKDGILEFVAPNAFTKDWIQRHYYDVLKETARSMDGRSWRVLLYQGNELGESLDGESVQAYPCLGSFANFSQTKRDGSRVSQEGGRAEENRGHGKGAPFSNSDRRAPLVDSREGDSREGDSREVDSRMGDPREGGTREEEAGNGGGKHRDQGKGAPGGVLAWDQVAQPGEGKDEKEGGAPLYLSQGAPESSKSESSAGESPRTGSAALGATQGRRKGRGRVSSCKGGETSRENLGFFTQNSDQALNPGFTFENFVVGSCNELTFAAAKAVAEFPGGPYNPLFIHGASGLGKTHLLQGICHAVLRGKTPRRILYLSCENFINQFIQAVTNGNISDFRYNCRHVDMLLVDDIQMLEGKSRTQEEFFHTFNTLFNNQKQIVLSSDRAPKELRTLQDRLISRFGWGMVTRLDSPCLETRIAIVKRKARMRSFELSDEVARFLAEHVDTNVRELEGAVTKLLGIANLMKRRIDLSLAEEVLHDYRPSARRVPIHKIMEAVAREFGVQSRDLQSKTRVHSVVLPRQIAIFLARKYTPLSLKQIGGFFGDRNHATIMHSIKKAEQILEEDEEIRERVQELVTKLLREA